jgi:uncharacterized protein YegP (UPF0339 family)
MGKYEVFTGDDGKFYFHLKARNGEIIVPSQGYETKAGRMKGIKSLRRNAPFSRIVDLDK